MPPTIHRRMEAVHRQALQRAGHRLAMMVSVDNDAQKGVTVLHAMLETSILQTSQSLPENQKSAISSRIMVQRLVTGVS